MANGLMVITMGEDGIAEGVIRRDIDMTFVHEDVVIIQWLKKLS